MSRSTRRSTTSTKSPGWILLQTEVTPLGKSLINLNAPRWSRLRTSTRRTKSLSGRLQVMTKRMKYFLTETFSRLGVLRRLRSWMSSIDYLSEEKYNLMKEKYNNMPKKKKKIKKKKKKAKKKKKR